MSPRQRVRDVPRGGHRAVFSHVFSHLRGASALDAGVAERLRRRGGDPQDAGGGGGERGVATSGVSRQRAQRVSVGGERDAHGRRSGEREHEARHRAPGFGGFGDLANVVVVVVVVVAV